ncbi:hypothetical protein [Aquimarina brevivitae]|uniref:Uncharacterized protein n=1 Tax=Aquimarina brevivitae TaxID=323412 RepID=A0A4Q7PLA3_9FLAO|nr:hypothetical protein [Aquimarina brevivitae]RZS99742.1 hypothetical protein EV197_0968 [Aquimarina brevivitae]
MRFIRVRRRTKTEKRYHKKMGILTTQVTYIKKYAGLLPLRTLHKYRMTYYGEVKDCRHCSISS